MECCREPWDVKNEIGHRFRQRCSFWKAGVTREIRYKRGLLFSERLYANEHLWGRLEGDKGYLKGPECACPCEPQQMRGTGDRYKQAAGGGPDVENLKGSHGWDR